MSEIQFRRELNIRGWKQNWLEVGDDQFRRETFPRPASNLTNSFPLRLRKVVDESFRPRF